MAFASLGLSAVQGGLGFIGAMQQGNAASAAARYQSQVARNNETIARQNAEYAAAAGGAQAQASDYKARAELGDTYAKQAASGIDAGIGSPQAVRDSQASINRLDTETLYANAMQTVRGYNQRAEDYRAQAGLSDRTASNAKTAGLFSGFSSLLGGATSFGDKWMRYQASGVSGF
jgi:hypothetical protein